MKKTEILKLLKEMIDYSTISIYIKDSEDEGNYANLIDPYLASRFVDEEMKKHEKEKEKEKKLNEL